MYARNRQSPYSVVYPTCRADPAGEEGHPIVEVPDAERLEAAQSLGVVAGTAVTRSALRRGAGQVQRAHVRHNDQGAREVAP
jgi:hypothetical protein